MLGVVIPSEREQKSWTEGVAIWVAVAVVSGVGESSMHHSGQRNAPRALEQNQRAVRGQAMGAEMGDGVCEAYKNLNGKCLSVASSMCFCMACKVMRPLAKVLSQDWYRMLPL